MWTAVDATVDRIKRPVIERYIVALSRQGNTDNFTHRNGSSVVVQAVDAALEGVFADKPFWRTLLRLMFLPDMWLAGSVRVRAQSLAWSPGLALDYISAPRDRSAL